MDRKVDHFLDKIIGEVVLEINIEVHLGTEGLTEVSVLIKIDIV